MFFEYGSLFYLFGNVADNESERYLQNRRRLDGKSYLHVRVDPSRKIIGRYHNIVHATAPQLDSGFQKRKKCAYRFGDDAVRYGCRGCILAANAYDKSVYVKPEFSGKSAYNVEEKVTYLKYRGNDAFALLFLL